MSIRYSGRSYIELCEAGRALTFTDFYGPVLGFLRCIVVDVLFKAIHIRVHLYVKNKSIMIKNITYCIQEILLFPKLFFSLFDLINRRNFLKNKNKTTSSVQNSGRKISK